MSVSTKFQTFCQDIKISSSVHSSVSYRYKRITKQLNLDFWNSDSDTSHSLYVGSYGRDTAIHVSDVDMLMRLPVSYYHSYDAREGNGQSALLQAVRNSLQKTYPTSRLKGDGQVVVVAFDDGIKFEILPCFLNDDTESFTYPNTNNGGQWQVTNPSPEIKAIRDGNVLWSYNLKHLCRMARVWKDEWSAPIGGILIDTLAYNFMSTWQHRDKSYVYYDYMVRDFFKYLKDLDTSQEYWLAPGSRNRVYSEGYFQYKALRCYNVAVEAVHHEANERPWSANQKWREIFGSKFKG